MKSGMFTSTWKAIKALAGAFVISAIIIASLGLFGAGVYQLIVLLVGAQ